MYRSETDCTSCSIVCNLEMLTEAFDRGPRCDNVVGAKDEKEISSRPVRICPTRPYLRKNTEMRQKVTTGVFRPYLWDPVFSRDIPVLVSYL